MTREEINREFRAAWESLVAAVNTPPITELGCISRRTRITTDAQRLLRACVAVPVSTPRRIGGSSWPKSLWPSEISEAAGQIFGVPITIAEDINMPPDAIRLEPFTNESAKKALGQ